MRLLRTTLAALAISVLAAADENDGALLDLLVGLEARVVSLETRVTALEPEMWRGILVAPEERCSDYDRDDFRWRGPVKAIREELIERDGGWDLYAGTALPGSSIDVDHVVAVKEAADSGACHWPDDRKRDFGNWRGNLVPTRASLNRSKGSRDASEWLPVHGRCELAEIVLATRRHWSLSIDRAEADALDAVLETCK